MLVPNMPLDPFFWGGGINSDITILFDKQRFSLFNHITASEIVLLYS